LENSRPDGPREEPAEVQPVTAGQPVEPNQKREELERAMTTARAKRPRLQDVPTLGRRPRPPSGCSPP
jgi:hypothetical protein